MLVLRPVLASLSSESRPGAKPPAAATSWGYAFQLEEAHLFRWRPLRWRAERIREYVTDTAELVNEALRTGKSVLFEGAQGTMLDIDHGTYPYVTSSSATAGGACTGIGVPPERRESLFKPFQLTPMSASNKTGGSGLGLAIGRWSLRLSRSNLFVVEKSHLWIHKLVSIFSYL